MAATITQIRNGLATRLATIDGLTVRARPGRVHAHTAVVEPGEPAITYDSTMARGSDDFAFVVTVVVGQADQELSQELLDPYLDPSGPQSIKAAIEGDETLGGIVSFVRVAACTEYGDVEVAGVIYTGASFAIEGTT